MLCTVLLQTGTVPVVRRFFSLWAPACTHLGLPLMVVICLLLGHVCHGLACDVTDLSLVEQTVVVWATAWHKAFCSGFGLDIMQVESIYVADIWLVEVNESQNKILKLY